MNMKQKGEKTNPVASFLWTDKKRRAKNFCFILTVFVIFAAVAIGFVNSKLELLTENDDDVTYQYNTGQEEISQTTYEEEDIIDMDSVDSASSVNEYLYQWSNNNGELYRSDNVINVLLLGLDSADALEEGGRSDSMILVSLNKETQKINMISFFRDSWTYMNIGGQDRYNKTNASYFYSGPSGLIDTIEKNYKIDIDYYVAVDFSSFVDIINALGGLTVEVQEYEANYINRTTRYNIAHGPAVTLNGEEALVFARIRKSDSDSDVSRTRRQRMVITSLIQSAKGASLSQLNDAVDVLFTHVKTDLNKMQIVSYAAQALANGWVNYEIIQHSFLSESDVFRGGNINGSSVVFIDYPLAAQKVQLAVYGDTNIILEEDRVKIFSLV